MTSEIELDIDLDAIEQETRQPTANLLEWIFPYNPFPKSDAAGIARLGIGRPLEKRAMPLAVARFALNQDIEMTQAQLRGRVFELVARHPEFKMRLPYLYTLADIMGAEEFKGWNKLWELLNKGDLEGASAELIVAKWDVLIGSTEAARKAIFLLISRLQVGVPAQ